MTGPVIEGASISGYFFSPWTQKDLRGPEPLMRSELLLGPLRTMAGGSMDTRVWRRT